MNARTWSDEHGHPWPVTGDWCASCGLPMTTHEDGQEVHPTCHPSSAA